MHFDGTSEINATHLEVMGVAGMGSWVVFICGALMSMHVLGINLAPLLTVGGISGIVVGLSAQVGACAVPPCQLSLCQGSLFSHPRLGNVCKQQV